MNKCFLFLIGYLFSVIFVFSQPRLQEQKTKQTNITKLENLPEDRKYWLILKKESIEQKLKKLKEKLKSINYEIETLFKKGHLSIKDKKELINRWLIKTNPFFIHLKRTRANETRI